MFLVFGCGWMIYGEVLIFCLVVDSPATLIPISQLCSEARLQNGPDGLGLLSHIEHERTSRNRLQWCRYIHIMGNHTEIV